MHSAPSGDWNNELDLMLRTDAGYVLDFRFLTPHPHGYKSRLGVRFWISSVEHGSEQSPLSGHSMSHCSTMVDPEVGP